MPDLDVKAIPGYLEAVERERLVRDASFLPVTESIAGFEVLPMTLRHYLILRSAGNALLYKRTPTPFELAAFLWVLNPLFCLSSKQRNRFLRKQCRQFIPPLLPVFKTKGAIRKWQKQTAAALARAALVIKAARDYVIETNQDRAAYGNAVNGFTTSYYSDAADICGALAKEFGWDDEAILDKPLKRIFQYLKRMDTRPKFNPSDEVRGRWIDTINANVN